MALKDQWGKPLFDNIVIGLVCEACKATGASCNHKLAMSPEWKPRERMNKVDAVVRMGVCVQMDTLSSHLTFFSL